MNNRIYYLALALITLVIGCELLDPNPGPTPVVLSGNGNNVIKDTLPPSIARGKNLYAELCASCHGDSAEGAISYSGSIVGLSHIDSVVRYGRKAMPAFPSLSDSSIKSIELFLASLVKISPNQTGRELFVQFCSQCHGDSASGAATFSGSIRGYSPIHDIVRNGYRTMAAIALPDSSIQKIQDYLLTLKMNTKDMTGLEYFQANCASCHGTKGEGSGTRGCIVQMPVVGYSSWVIRNGRLYDTYNIYSEKMPAFNTDTLSEKQLTEIMTWLQSMPKPTTGGDLYVTYCQNCHGANGISGPAGINLKREINNFSKVIRSGKGGTNYGNRKDYMPSWKSSEITDAEIKLMQTYVNGL